MNIYGKKASAYYSLHQGLHYLKQGDESPTPVAFDKNDPIAEELEEFANCVRDGGEPEVGGERASKSLAVIRAGVKSVREGRVVTVAEIMETGE